MKYHCYMLVFDWPGTHGKGHRCVTSITNYHVLSQRGVYSYYKILPVSMAILGVCLVVVLLPSPASSGVARIFRWGGGQDLKKGTCINSKQVILACRECSGAYIVIIINFIGGKGGFGGSPPENFFLNCFKMVHFHGSSIIMFIGGLYLGSRAI